MLTVDIFLHLATAFVIFWVIVLLNHVHRPDVTTFITILLFVAFALCVMLLVDDILLAYGVI